MPFISQRARVPAWLWTVLAWSGFVLSPIAMVIWARHGSTGYGLPIAAVILPVGVLPRRPWVVLGLLLVEALAVELLTAPSLRWNPGFHLQIRILLAVAMDLAVGYLAATRRLLSSIAAAVGVLIIQLCIAAAVKLVPGFLGDLGTTALRDVLELASIWMIGNTFRLRRQYSQARRAQAEVQAVQAERLRIARELHDMVAHSIGVIAIQAGMGRRIIDTRPAEAGNALRAIEDTSRDTLAGLRQMLRALRQANPESVSAPLEPMPGLASLDGLVARSAHAGVRVNVQWRGDTRPLRPDIDLSAFRIIQEAITNVVRHAGTNHCDVVVAQHDDELYIEVTDDGQGGVEGSGYGIPGMRERVDLLHGEFTANSRPEGGFQIAARIPLSGGVQ